MSIVNLSYRNWAAMDGASVTASSATALQPVTNLQTPVLTQRHRTLSGVTSYSIVVDFGQTRSVGILALAQPADAGYVKADGEAAGGFASTDTIQHRLDMTTPGAGVMHNSGIILGGWAQGYGLHVYKLSAAVNARYWRIDINAPSLTSLGYCDLGYLWAGSVFQPQRNFSFGNQDGLIDNSVVSRNARSGLTLVDVGSAMRTLSFGLDNLDETEARGTLKELRRVVGLKGTLLCVPDPSAYVATEAIIGRLREIPSISQPNLVQCAAAFQIIQNL